MMKNIFQTSNLSLAAAILSSGEARFVKAIQYSPFKLLYVFTPHDVCKEIQIRYINNELSMPVREVEENIKVLKSLAQRGVKHV